MLRLIFVFDMVFRSFRGAGEKREAVGLVPMRRLPGCCILLTDPSAVHAGAASADQFLDLGLYPGGKNIDDVAVYSENGKDYTRADDKVGQMKPNALKIFDMSCTAQQELTILPR